MQLLEADAGHPSITYDTHSSPFLPIELFAMLAKFFQKGTNQSQERSTEEKLDLRVAVHYGIPATASILTFDSIQNLLAIGTLDGRIKIIGGDNIEGLFISPKQLPFKNLEFLQNQGFLVSVSNDNEIQVWDLEKRHLASTLRWESNISAFSVIYGTHYMYIGDEYGFLSVLKYDTDQAKLLHLAYHVPADLIAEEAGVSIPDHLSVVGLLPQPCSSGKRVLIAYENGLLVLWDVSEDRAVLVRGFKDLQLKNATVVGSSSDATQENVSDKSDDEQAEKDISSLCWVTSDGSVLAVGYVDGDILLWNLSASTYFKDQKANASSNSAIKLQLSSADRRLPVIVLHWSSASSHNGCGGQLFVYGGDEIGSEEVLTILTLDWSSGIEALQCVNRVDLTLNGSYADMILVPNAGAVESTYTSTLFVLTNPGQLHFYDDGCLSALISHPDKKHSVDAVQYPVIIPTIEPYMTVGKLFLVHIEGALSSALEETVSASKPQSGFTASSDSTKWPVTGGIPSQLSLAPNCKVERVYIAGYQDGSVRIWDATFPVLSLIFVLGSQVEGIEVTGASASISALDFFSSTSCVAIGNEHGLVCQYSLVGRANERSMQIVSENKHEVIDLPNGKGAQCTAVFSLLKSPVCTLQYLISGDRLAVGFESGQVAMLDVTRSSVLFLTECLAGSNCPVTSLAVKVYKESPDNALEQFDNTSSNKSIKEVAVIFTKDAHAVLMDSTSGKVISSKLINSEQESTAISVYILEENISVFEVSEKNSLISSRDSEAKKESEESNYERESDLVSVKADTSNKATHLQTNMDSLILLCCEDSVCLYSLKSLTQGETSFINKVDLGKSCCWTTIYKKDGKESGVILVYHTGEIEIRSLPDLAMVGETSLMSILRWSFKTNMDRLMSSSGSGQITMVNGSEFACVSLLAFENDLRIPEALPSLHDKALAAAADTPLNFSEIQKKQSTGPRILGGIIKGLKGGKEDQGVNQEETREIVIAKLESMFSRTPFSISSIDIPDDLDLAVDIDDIIIDEPKPLPSPSGKSKNEKDSKGKEKEREKLFEGGSTDTAPRPRTAEEIRAKYRKSGDVSAVAGQAKDKLLERGEKLEKLSRRTEELQDGAQNFASMANELAKRMENRKWWQL